MSKKKKFSKPKAAKSSHGPSSLPAPGRPPRRAPLNAQHQFSLRDEAHNTGRQSHWTVDTKLRNRAVTFVSASVHSTVREQAAPFAQPATAGSPPPRPREDNSLQPEHSGFDMPACPAFYVDVTGDASVAQHTLGSRVRSSSVHSKCSASSEEIMFRGRASRPTVIEDPVPHATEGSSSLTAESVCDTGVEWVHRSKPGVGWSAPRSRRRPAIRAPVLTFRPKHGDSAEDDSAIDDYLENIRKHDPQLLEAGHFSNRVIDSHLSAAHLPFSAPSENEAEQHDGLRTHEGEIIGGDSRADDVSDDSHSTGELMSSAHDVSESSDDEEDDEDAETRGSGGLEAESNEEDDSDSDISDGLHSAREPGVLDDETLAMLYDMQEQMGISDDELVLFDESVDARVTREAQGYCRQKPTKARRNAGSFPSATLLADILDEDPYNGFGVMAMDRPSLRKNNKGKAAKLLPEFELSDTELAESLRTQWKRDREKKRVRKQEREELRGQGRVGKRKARISDTFGEGMTVRQIGDEMERFLRSGEPELAFPPMDKRRRKMIHELANSFNVKTKSVGNGNGRYTKMIRTKNTAVFDKVRFEAKATRFERHFFPRTDTATGRSTRSVRSAFGHNAPGVRYADGEVVGATAPELGADNRGRAMLEKLGWVSGMALGAASNKGILEPITHVVKNSKAGLG